MRYPPVRNFVGGRFLPFEGEHLDVISPVDGSHLSRVPLSKVLVDGRGATVPGCEGGFYVGPTVIDHVRPEMRIAREEIFGPVLAIIRVGTLDEAMTIENDSPYGNAAAVYTQNGEAAREFIQQAGAGMIGVNVGVPVPREPFGFGGWNDSRFGVGDVTGRSSIAFWTQSKKVTMRW